MADDRIAAILADPEAHGFRFHLKDLNKNGVPLKQCPHVEVVDLKTFEVAFPGLALKSVNGQSIAVGSDRVSRDYAYDNQAQKRETRDAAIKRMSVEWLLGIKATRELEVVKFAGPEGTVYDTLEEQQAAWTEWAANQ